MMSFYFFHMNMSLNSYSTAYMLFTHQGRKSPVHRQAHSSACKRSFTLGTNAEQEKFPQRFRESLVITN